MTEKECQMMNTIHFWGLLLSLNDAQKIALERMEAISEAQHE